MDNFWIYLIIGGIMLLAPKGKSRTNKGKEVESPTNDDREQHKDPERELRELLGESSAERQAPSNTIIRPAQANARSSAKRVPSPKKASPASDTCLRNTHAPKAQNPHKATNGTPTTTSGQIEGILEDFTMEKAVIYSEILRPKYEEY